MIKKRKTDRGIVLDCCPVCEKVKRGGHGTLLNEFWANVCQDCRLWMKIRKNTNELAIQWAKQSPDIVDEEEFNRRIKLMAFQ